MNFLSTKELRCVEGVSYHLAPHPSPLLHLLCPWEAPSEEASLPLVLYPQGKVSIPQHIWAVPTDLPVERGWSPFVFQSGLWTCCAGCQLDEQPLARVPTASPSLLSLHSPPSSLPSLLPLGVGKAVQIFQVYRKGSRSCCSCFSTSPQHGNSSVG